MFGIGCGNFSENLMCRLAKKVHTLNGVSLSITFLVNVFIYSSVWFRLALYEGSYCVGDIVMIA